MNSLIDLKDKTALVTGGTKGIGKAIADELARAGAKVVVTARTKPEKSEHHFIAADLVNASDVDNLATYVSEHFGNIDILINNVGGITAPGGGYSTLTTEDWENELQLNLLSAIRLDKMVLPHMTRKGCVIIHISSIAGKQPLWNSSLAYAVSKAALNTYSKALATELAQKGIRVLTVAPGPTKTANMEKFVSDFAASNNLTSEEATKELVTQVGGIPMGRFAETDEVASLVHFLVSPSAAYLTGAIYTIDGGALPVVS